jgi:hypothetical protein
MYFQLLRSNYQWGDASDSETQNTEHRTQNTEHRKKEAERKKEAGGQETGGQETGRRVSKGPPPFDPLPAEEGERSEPFYRSFYVLCSLFYVSESPASPHC